jgi:hypothetical protein
MAAAENAASGLRGLTDFLTPTADRRPPTADRRPPTADRRPPTATARTTAT